MPARTFMSVDLPVPLPPTRPMRSRDVMSQSAFSKRSLWPKRFPAPESWIMGLELSSHKNSGQGRVGRGQKLQPRRALRFTKGYKNKLWPDYRGDGIFLGGCGAGVALGGVGAPKFVVVLDAFQGAVDHGFEFAGIFYFAAFGEATLGFFRAHPRG